MPNSAQWLTIAQAAAWVMFRTSEAVQAADSAEGFAGLKFATGTSGDGCQVWGIGTPSVGSVKELLAALLAGDLHAIGRKPGSGFTRIAAYEWETLAVAPRDLRRQHPYEEIRVDKRALFRRWPRPGAERSSIYQRSRARELYDEIMRERPGLKQTPAARELRARYERTIAKEPLPTHSACVHWIKAWETGSQS